MIEFHNLTKSYPTGQGPVTVLKGLNLFIAKGEFVSIMGPSGSGKSTIAAILGCLALPSSGIYRLDGTEVNKQAPRKIAALRNEKIGFIFQEFNLLEGMTTVENVALPLVYAGVPARQRRKRATEALEKVNLQDRLNHVPKQLSGGQKQRVAIARALVNDPALIFADEPTGALDAKNTTDVMVLLQRLNMMGHTIVQVTHAHEDAQFSKRILHINDGQIVRDEFVENYNVQGQATPELGEASRGLECLWSVAAGAKSETAGDVLAVKRLFRATKSVTGMIAAGRALMSMRGSDFGQLAVRVFRHPHWAVRAEVVKSADVNVHPQALGLFVAGLRDENPWIRFTSLVKLGSLAASLQTIGGADEIKHCLRDDDDRVRAATVNLICRWNEPDLLEPLLALARTDRNVRVRSNALEALATFAGSPRSSEVLDTWHAAAAEPHHRIATTAAVLLNRVGKSEGAETIRKFRASSVAIDRAAAAWALGEMAPPEEFGNALLEMARTEIDEMVRRDVAKSLAKQRGRGFDLGRQVDLLLGAEPPPAAEPSPSPIPSAS